MCKDRKKLSNTEQKITKCNKKAFHVEHRKRSTWNTNGAQARTAREARRPKPQTGKLAAKRQATGRPNAAKASGFLKGAALMRSKSGPDKNRRQSKEGQGAKPIAASLPNKAEDRSEAERSRPQPSTQARTRRRKKRS